MMTVASPSERAAPGRRARCLGRRPQPLGRQRNARWQSGLLLAFIGAACAVQGVITYGPGAYARGLALVTGAEFENSSVSRRLKTKQICKGIYGDGNKNRVRGHDFSGEEKRKIRTGANCNSITTGNPGIFVLSVLIVLYLFVGVAIVCDELFVSALEVIAEKWELSDDVSGATLMAAGGSAPELATAFLGTFQGSTVGLGTIVGSAVFNVLFVIGMCAIKTPQEFVPLQLTWWPLARDCTYYILTLLALLIWFIGGGKGSMLPIYGSDYSSGAIEGWEAAVQIALYFGYVFLMKNNVRLEAWVKSRLNHNSKVEPEKLETLEWHDQRTALPDVQEGRWNKPSTFRASIVSLLSKGGNVSNTAGVGVVSKIKGDVRDTFSQLDIDGDGKLDMKELRQLILQLGDPGHISDEDVVKLKSELDKDGNDTIDINEFTSWYISSENRLKAQSKMVFDAFDLNKNGTIDITEVREVVAKLAEGNASLRTQVEAAVDDFKTAIAHSSVAGAGADLSCNFDEFHEWYESTIFWKQAKMEAQEAQEAVEGMWFTVVQSIVTLPEKTPTERFVVLFFLPLNGMLALTVPDCRVPGKEGYCYATFGGSILWIGVFAYFMVWCIENIGCFTGVPPFLMGLIPLAAGTSVPDLLSSVVVAKQGKGDMAVSSSIGSNIFDVAIGLPVPWLCFNIYYGCPVQVGGTAENNSLSVLILLFMVILVVVSIALSDWKMSANLGYIMFSLYFFFCAQEIYRAYG